MWQTHNFGSHVSVTRGIETTECDRYMTTNLYFFIGLFVCWTLSPRCYLSWVYV